MTARTILIVVLAVVFGVAAAVYATNAMSKTRGDGGEKVNVVITLKPVPRGSHLTAEMLDLKPVTKDDAPDDALHTIDEAVKDGGRVTAFELVKGDFVLEGKLAKAGAKEGMAPLIRKENQDGTVTWMQAATILTPTAAAGVGGFIHPGDNVDVLLTVDHFEKDDHGGTVRLMQRVEVLATDSHMEAAPTTVEGKVVDHREMRYVTLLVTPKQAQELALAQKHGTLTLSLRNPEDKEVLPTTPVTKDDLKFPTKPAAPEKPEGVPAATVKQDPPAPQIRVIRNGAESP
ncbi:MAG TPA: Flp pilus assembly protein CpaB [Gemmataceae bacterium]|nr:Flp pilus assembly protein CpaB [Gemmataceae bacterium]